MLDSINRMEGSTVDWSQLPGIKRTTSKDTTVAASYKEESEKGELQESKDKLYKELEKANRQFDALNHSLRMKFNEEAEQFYVEVVDVQTREVIDSIPAEYVLDLAAKLKDMVGFFIDEKR